MKSCEVAYEIMRSDTNESEFDGRTDDETSRELLFIEPIIHWAMKKCTESQSVARVSQNLRPSLVECQDLFYIFEDFTN